MWCVTVWYIQVERNIPPPAPFDSMGLECKELASRYTHYRFPRLMMCFGGSPNQIWGFLLFIVSRTFS